MSSEEKGGQATGNLLPRATIRLDPLLPSPLSNANFPPMLSYFSFLKIPMFPPASDTLAIEHLYMESISSHFFSLLNLANFSLYLIDF